MIVLGVPFLIYSEFIISVNTAKSFAMAVAGFVLVLLEIFSAAAASSFFLVFHKETGSFVRPNFHHIFPDFVCLVHAGKMTF